MRTRSIWWLAIPAAGLLTFLAYDGGGGDGASSAREPSLGTALGSSDTPFAEGWENLPSMKEPRSEMTVVQYRDDVYAFNGFAPNIKIEPSVERFDAATRTWSVVATTSVALGTAVTHNGIVRVGKDVWLIGGRIGSHPGKVTDAVWIYDLERGTFREGPKLPIPGAGGGAALVDNRIHWFGGLDPLARCDVDRHVVFDLDLPSAGWQDITGVAAMPLPRNHFSTVTVGGLIYAIGGQNSHDGCPHGPRGNVAQVHRFDPATNDWDRLSDLPSVQSHAEPSTFVHEGHIFLVGGQARGDKVMRYLPGKDEWKQVAALPEPLLAPIARIVDGGLMVASGGAPNTANPTAKVRFLPASVSETPEPEAPEPEAPEPEAPEPETPEPETPEPETPEPETPEPETPEPETPEPETPEPETPEPETPEPETPEPETPEPETPEPETPEPETPEPETPEPETPEPPEPETPEPETPVAETPDAPAVPEALEPKALADGESLVSIEAEYHDLTTESTTHRWRHTNRDGASNDASMITTPDYGALSETGADAPMMSYFVRFDRPGTHYVWVRGWGGDKEGEGRGDSLHVGLNGALVPETGELEGFPMSAWHWSRDTRRGAVASLEVPSAGVHALNVWMREDGLAVDKIVVTSDPAFVPAGTGPMHDDGTDASDTPTSMDDSPADADAASGGGSGGGGSIGWLSLVLLLGGRLVAARGWRCREIV